MTLSIYDFGRELLRTRDLDPVYVILQGASFEPVLLRRYLVAYWCFYHMGTAAWIADSPKELGEVGYWNRMMAAAGSKDYPRCSERRHFRGGQAIKSVTWLKGQGIAGLFDPLENPIQGGWAANNVMFLVRQWVGFGPWIAFKVADMLERLGIVPIVFSPAEALYDSPREAAEVLWDMEGQPSSGFGSAAGEWAMGRILTELDGEKAPPRYERGINAQEAETILCKWLSYTKGRYHVGEDIESCRRSLFRFPKCESTQKLLKAAKAAKLW